MQRVELVQAVHPEEHMNMHWLLEIMWLATQLVHELGPVQAEHTLGQAGQALCER